MDTALWVVQGLLAVVFLAAGLTKLTQPRAKMAAGPMPWAADVSGRTVPCGPSACSRSRARSA